MLEVKGINSFYGKAHVLHTGCRGGLSSAEDAIAVDRHGLDRTALRCG